MAQTVISSKFQIVIPKEIRQEIGLKTGQVLQVIGMDGVIALVPDVPISRLRGYLKGMSKGGLRNKKDRL